MKLAKQLMVKSIPIVTVTLVLGVFVFNMSYAKDGPTKKFVTWRPYQDYMSLFIKSESLNEMAPVGLSIGEIYSIIKETYIPGEQPLYIDGVLVVNKDFGLPPEFGLDGRNQEAVENFKLMKADAREDGIYLSDFSNYRSYDRQVQLYGSYVSKHGEDAANRFSAKPGYSEHQSGYTSDIGGRDSSAWANENFDNTKEAKWLAENAHKYGYVLRYPKNKEHITGYMHESWHYRYVGKKHSSKIYTQNLTLEEYLGLDKIKNITKYENEIF